MAMNRRRTLITSPLDWFLNANPVPPPAIPVLAERGGTQLKTPRPVIVVDTREQNPFDFARFQGWFSGVERRALKLGDYSISGLEDSLRCRAQGSLGSGALLHHRAAGVCRSPAADGRISSPLVGGHDSFEPSQIALSSFGRQSQPDYAIVDRRACRTTGTVCLH